MNRPRRTRPKSEKAIGWLIIIAITFIATYVGALLLLVLVQAWRAVFL